MQHSGKRHKLVNVGMQACLCRHRDWRGMWWHGFARGMGAQSVFEEVDQRIILTTVLTQLREVRTDAD